MNVKNSKSNNIIIESRFKELLARKGRLENRNITYEDVVSETGISKSSIQKWATNTLGRRDDKTVIAFMIYFDCTINELLVVRTIEPAEDDSEGEIKEPLAA